MNYAKPEVVVLGDAIQLIENSTLKGGHFLENPRMQKGITPAYDLDE